MRAGGRAVAAALLLAIAVAVGGGKCVTYRGGESPGSGGTAEATSRTFRLANQSEEPIWVMTAGCQNNPRWIELPDYDLGDCGDCPCRTMNWGGKSSCPECKCPKSRPRKVPPGEAVAWEWSGEVFEHEESGCVRRIVPEGPKIEAEFCWQKGGTTDGDELSDPSCATRTFDVERERDLVVTVD